MGGGGIEPVILMFFLLLFTIVPPEIYDSHHGPVEVTVIEGRPVILPCRVSGSPTPSITWQKGLVPVTEAGVWCGHFMLVFILK